MKINKKTLKAAKIALQKSVMVKRNENLVIITDKICQNVARAFFIEGNKINATTILVEINPLEEHGNEPPDIIGTILKDCDVFVIPTSKSITHTKARREASLYGPRGVTLPGITEDIFTRTIAVDYKKLASRTNKITALLTSSKRAKISTKSGTDIMFDLSHRSGHADTGLVSKPGSFSNLPAGEAYIAPLSCDGKIVIDGSIASFGIVKRPVEVEIKDGKAASIKGDRGRLKRKLENNGPAALTIGELGVGTNQHATISGNILEDEKACGTIHIAFGDNLGFGGNNSASIHIDCLIKKPTVILDEQTILKDGSFSI